MAASHLHRMLGMVAALLPLIATAAQEPPDNRRPNIIFILTDDQAPTAAGFAGNTELKTPALDRLAREGVVLPNSFVTTPVCSPSRAGLAVSRYGSELGILDWINPSTEPQLGLPPETVTWMELLQRAGYRLGLFGKWHLGIQPRFHPTQMGYHEFAGILEGGCKPIGATIEVAGKPVSNIGYTADVFTDHALDFIRRHAGTPFVCSLHFREPHAAWRPCPEEDWVPYRDLDPTLPDPDIPGLRKERLRGMLREYYASVAGVDRNVGRLLALLSDLSLADNTLVIFTSDHGYHTGHHGLWYKGNAQWQVDPLPPQQWDAIPAKQRPNLYDQALRVPTVIRWPSRIAAGQTIGRCITNLDWYPTLLAAAGVTPDPDVVLRGRNALPLLLGETPEWDDGFYAEYSMRHGATTDMRAWRTPEWKLVLDFANPGREELYDLVRDPREKINLIDSDRPEAQRARQDLEHRIRTRRTEIGDLSSEPAPRPDLSFPGETIDAWHGGRRHTFQFQGRTAWVVEPRQPLPGNPWSWCMMFPNAFTTRCAAPQLVAAGFHHAYLDVGNTFGSPAAVAQLAAFRDDLVRRGLAPKAALVGLSRGGLYAHRYASEHPDHVAVIYGDAGVCDFKSWPGGKGKGKGSPRDWKACLEAYGFADEAAALAYAGNPIDTLEPLAKAGVALIHVVGDADHVVPPAENALIMEKRYPPLGGTITVIHKPDCDHHPHGLDDPQPVVNFILQHAVPKR